jgi:hypothetical protein
MVRIHATPGKVVSYLRNLPYLATTASHSDGDGCSDSRHSCSRLAPSSAQWAVAVSAKWAVVVSAQWAVAVSAKWAVAVSAKWAVAVSAQWAVAVSA